MNKLKLEPHVFNLRKTAIEVLDAKANCLAKIYATERGFQIITKHEIGFVKRAFPNTVEVDVIIRPAVEKLYSEKDE